MSSIKLSNVDFEYFYYSSLGSGLLRGNSKKHKSKALSNVTLDIQEGDRVALFGKNGSGKSTLLRVIAGIYPAKKGSVELTGKIYSFFGKSVGLNQFLSGYENLKIRGLLLQLKKKRIEETIKRIEIFTELGEALNRPVSTYSQGMKARLTFGMMMYVDADIMLIDEGLGAGDRFFIDKARAFVDELLDNSKILIFASHSEHLLKRFCNKALLMKEGEVVKYGEFDEVCNMYQTGEF